MSYAFVACLFLFVLLMSAASAEAQRPPGTAARVVVIRPKEGMARQFEEGYKRHLEWHRQNRDTWTWYGWQVVTGERLGHFVDGTFGRQWEDFDRAVAPAADAADNASNVAPYGDFLSVAQYVLLPELSRARLLEEGAPSPFVEVLYYHLHAGREGEFERVLRRAHEAHGRAQHPRLYTWYKLVSGGSHPAYMLLLPRNKLADFRQSEESFAAVLEDARPREEAAKLLKSLREAVREVRSETLRYRPDMSYFPPDN